MYTSLKWKCGFFTLSLSIISLYLSVTVYPLVIILNHLVVRQTKDSFNSKYVSMYFIKTRAFSYEITDKLLMSGN